MTRITVRLVPHKHNDWPADWRDELWDPWTYAVEGKNEVHYREPSNRVPFFEEAIGHELRHLVNRYDADDPNDDVHEHHNPLHFCLAVGHRFRFWWHSLGVTKRMVLTLIRRGALTLEFDGGKVREVDA